MFWWSSSWLLTFVVLNNSTERGDGGTWHMADSFLSMKARKMAPRPRRENPRPPPLFLSLRCYEAVGFHYRTDCRANLASFGHFSNKRNPLFPVHLQTHTSATRLKPTLFVYFWCNSFCVVSLFECYRCPQRPKQSWRLNPLSDIYGLCCVSS